ncbi:hypothetical protein Afil01_53840 [Actinorhabdospora filicis]|uniref:SnoaL-like domain-containing protein n=1 Tax=Actinorhabdospora filicis TaxID=1785913 RepID=A0A9W6SQY2_9ACTN|nr:nuclear transport factor 2 family protein [Actinorhabdospora filicis]GLZ80577.1 hypothetical protein Afil01_53840 [Actinorhabdospora filicis]
MTPEELTDRTEIADALYRFAYGQDLKDYALFATSFAPDAVVDFDPVSQRWGAASPLMEGREVIVSAISGLFAGRVDTSHTITNVRATVDGDTATATALVEAQHLLSADHSVHALLKNIYDVTLVRDGSRWVISHLRLSNLWYTGDPRAIFG